MAKKKTKKKARRLPKLVVVKGRRKGPRRALPREISRGAIDLFTVWKLEEGHIIDMHGIPGDPNQISHYLVDILSAYAQAYSMVIGGNVGEYIATMLVHFGELIEERYSDEIEHGEASIPTAEESRKVH